MATYSFKSVGRTRTAREEEKTTVTQTPYGIRTPLQLGGNDGIFVMNTSVIDQISDNLRNFLQTNWGERLMHYDFGANLRPLATEYNSQNDFDDAAVSRIKAGVEKWMPYVDLEDFSSIVSRRQGSNVAEYHITVSFRVPSVSNDLRAVQVTIYVI